MITLYSGTPGSGKSLHAARTIIDTLNRGKTVIANFPINEAVVKKKKKGRFIYLRNSELTTEFLIEHAFLHHKVGREGQSVIVIDEAGIMFNSRDWGCFDRKSWVEFFMTHRHYGFDIIMISQIDRLIDRQIRAFIEYDVKHRKANNYKTIGTILSLLRISTFAAVTYWYGLRGEDARCGMQLIRYRKKDSQLYDTMMLFNNDNFGERIGSAEVQGEISQRSDTDRKCKLCGSIVVETGMVG